MPPHIEISLQQIYEELQEVKGVVRDMATTHKSLEKWKMVMYPTWATLLAGALALLTHHG